MSTRFHKNPAFEAQAEKAPEMKAFVKAATTTTAVAVRAAAPRHTDYYRTHVKPRGNRVLLEDFAWHWVEYGSINNFPYAPAFRGAKAAGLRYVEDLK